MKPPYDIATSEDGRSWNPAGQTDGSGIPKQPDAHWKIDLHIDAQKYVDIVNGRPNGWGAYCCPTTGAQSHVVLRAGMDKHGVEEFNQAVNAVLRL